MKLMSRKSQKRTQLLDYVALAQHVIEALAAEEAHKVSVEQLDHLLMTLHADKATPRERPFSGKSFYAEACQTAVKKYQSTYYALFDARNKANVCVRCCRGIQQPPLCEKCKSRGRGRKNCNNCFDTERFCSKRCRRLLRGPGTEIPMSRSGINSQKTHNLKRVNPSILEHSLSSELV